MDITIGMAKILHYLGFALYGGYLPAEAILLFLASQDAAGAYRGRALTLAARLTRSHALPGLILIGLSGLVLSAFGSSAGVTGFSLLILVPVAALEFFVSRRLAVLAARQSDDSEVDKLRGILRFRPASAAVLIVLVVRSVHPALAVSEVFWVTGAVLLVVTPFALIARKAIGPASTGLLPHA